MNAFITGATGFIGSNLLRLLVQKKIYSRIYVLTRQSSLLENIKDIDKENIEFIQGDLLEPLSYEKPLSRCEHVYHTAGFVGTNRAYREAVYKLNYETTKNLLASMEKTKPLKIMYLASIFALGKGDKDNPADENLSYNLNHFADKIPYFRAKREAELLAYRYCDRGMPLVFCFPCYCLGPGDIYLSSSRMVIASMCGFLHFYTEGGINVVDVRDVAEGFLLGMNKGKIGEKYILGGYNLTLKELFLELYKVTGRSYPLFKIPKTLMILSGLVSEFLSKRGAIIDYSTSIIMGEFWYYSSEKAKRELGYTVRPLAQTLRDSVEWLNTNKVYYGQRIL